LYDIKGTKIKTLTHSKAITSVCFSKDGKYILTGSEDNTAILWNLLGIKIQSFIGHTAAITQVKMSDDGRYILTASQDKTAILWNRNGTQKHKIKHSDKVLACDFSSDNETIVSGSFDGQIKIWNISGQETYSFQPYDWGLSSISISPNSNSFISTTETEEASINEWNFQGKLVRNLSGLAKVISAVSFSPDGKTILTGGKDGSLKRWNIFNNTFNSYGLHKASIGSIAIAPDGLSFVTGSEDRTAKLCNNDGKVLQTFQLNSKISSVCFSPDGKSILTGCYEGCTTLWNINGSKIKEFKQNERINAAVFAPDGRSIVTGDIEKVIRHYDLKGTLLKSIQGSSMINALSFSADGKSIITGCFSGILEVWDLATGYLEQTIGTVGEESLTVSNSKDGIYIASGDNAGMITLWNNKTQSIIKLSGHQTKVMSVNFSADSKMLLSGSADGSSKLWDCATGKELLTLISLDSSDWVVTSPNGLFDASPNAMLKMHYKVGIEIIDLDQLKERYYEPGLLSNVLKIRQNEIRDVSSFTSVNLYPEIDASIKNKQLLVHLKVRSGELGKLSLFINNKEVIEDANQGRNTEVPAINLNNFNKFYLADTNTISLRAYNKEGWLKSNPYELIYVNNTGSKGNENTNSTTATTSFKGKRHLYAVIVGTSDYSGEKLDLKFPDLDAAAMANGLQQVGSRIFDDRVHISLLTSNNSDNAKRSTKKNIEKAFMDIANLATANDLLIVYFSGHGTTYGQAEKSQFYYLTTDIKSDNLTEQAIRDAYTISSEDLTKWLTINPTKRQVLIFDACHSGEVIRSLENIGARELDPSQIRALERMKDRTGMFILTGSAADKVSYEASQFGQGLLTYSLLLGMSGFALTEDKRVDIATLFNYAKDKVPELANNIDKIQVPIFASPHGAESFDIGIVDKNVKIPIAQAKPIFIRNNFIDNGSRMDTLDIMLATKQYLQKVTSNGSEASIIYSDIDAFPEAYHLSGLYYIEGGNIRIDLKIIQGKTKVADVKHSGKINDIPTFVEGMFEKVIEKLNNK
ncbi:MAG: caspase family protein, partial [Saprospiraceae bacterium]